MEGSFATSRGRFAVAAGFGAALVSPLIATWYWDRRCRGADELCALGYLIWLNRSLLVAPVIGAAVAALLSLAGRRRRAGLITLGVTGALSWMLLWLGHVVWGW